MLWWQLDPTERVAPGEGVSGLVPPQLAELLYTEGLFDFVMDEGGNIDLNGRIKFNNEATARAMNVTLRLFLPQLLGLNGGFMIERQGAAVQLGNLSLSADMVREWGGVLLEAFAE